MKRSRRLLKPGGTAALLWFALGILLAAQVGALVRTDDPRRNRAAGDITMLPTPTPSSIPSPSKQPTPKATKKKVTTKKSVPARPRPVAVDKTLFGGLGAWVDVYDFDALKPAESVALMKRNGVRTLYIQTGRYNTKHDVAPEVDPWLREAHKAGLKVVGWYLPSYKRMQHDVDRTVAIKTYRTRDGHRFDALGIDIESRAEVKNVATWNERVAAHAERVRKTVGKNYLVTAITIVPLQQDIAPARWAGFPWKRLGAVSDVVMLMSYWSFRTDCSKEPKHCAYGYTYENIVRARALIADPTVPIHIAGGVADSISKAEVEDFVRAAKDAKAFGASMYDLRTTKTSYWAPLRALKNL